MRIPNKVEHHKALQWLKDLIKQTISNHKGILVLGNQKINLRRWMIGIKLWGMATNPTRMVNGVLSRKWYHLVISKRIIMFNVAFRTFQTGKRNTSNLMKGIVKHVHITINEDSSLSVMNKTFCATDDIKGYRS